MPALDPVCARAGKLASATAAAAAIAIAREAGLDGCALLGGRATIMCGEAGLSVRAANYGWNDLGSTQAGPWRITSRNPSNRASAGRANRVKLDSERDFRAK